MGIKKAPTASGDVVGAWKPTSGVGKWILWLPMGAWMTHMGNPPRWASLRGLHDVTGLVVRSGPPVMALLMTDSPPSGIWVRPTLSGR